MKTGICTWSLEVNEIKSPYDYIDYAKASGFQTIDLSLGGYRKFFDWMKLSKKAIIKHFTQFKKYADEQGIQVSQTHAPYAVFPKFLDRDFLKSQKRSILVTSLVGAEYMVLHPLAFPLYGGRAFDKEEMDYNLRFFRKILPELRKYNVKAAIENIFDWDKPHIRNIQFSYPEGINDLLKKLPPDYFVHCLDTGHLNIAGKPQEEMIKLIGSRLKVLHIHDNYGSLDEHVLPGQGNINWNDFTQALAEINFSGAISLEVKPEKSFFPAASVLADKLVSQVNEKRQYIK